MKNTIPKENFIHRRQCKEEKNVFVSIKWFFKDIYIHKTIARLNIILISIVAISILVTCSNSSDNSKEEKVYDEPVTVSEIIGPEGGTIVHDGGISITIPPGALEEFTEISIKLYESTHCFVRDMGGGLLRNRIAEFGPKGTTFLTPVTITFSDVTGFTPGSTYPLYELDETTHTWKETDFPVTVSPDGTTLEAEVTHFTIYQAFPDMGGRESALRGRFAQLLQENNGNFRIAMGYFMSEFYNLEPKLNIGDIVVTDDGAWTLEQVFFQIIAKDNNNEKHHEYSIGNASQRTAMDWVFNEAFDAMDSKGNTYNWDLLVTLHWEKNGKKLFISSPQDGFTLTQWLDLTITCVGIDVLTVGKFDDVKCIVDFSKYKNVTTTSTDPWQFIWNAEREKTGWYFLRLEGTSEGKKYVSNTVKIFWDAILIVSEGSIVSPENPDTWNLPRDFTMEIIFTEDMEPGPTEAAFAIGPDASTVFSWPAPNVMRIDIQGDYDTWYSICEGGSAKSLGGEVLGGFWCFQGVKTASP